MISGERLRWGVRGPKLKINAACPTIRGRLALPETSGEVWYGGLYEDAVDREQVFQELERNNVSIVWNLLDSGCDHQHERARFRHSLWTPIHDFSVPDDEQAFLRDLDQVIDWLDQGKNAYVHCYAGIGRTGMVLGALMVRLGVDTPGALMRVLKATGGPETNEQEQFVESIPPRRRG